MSFGSLFPLAVIGVLLIQGCSSSNDDELRQWMQSERNSIKPRIQPIPEPKKFEPKEYTVEQILEPFSGEKLASVLRGAQGGPLSNSALIEPELSRRKEPLEAYPLDTMTMVGSMDRQGQLVALIRVDKLLYQVRNGHYLGQNYGKITQISETEVLLREIVQDAAGEWMEKSTALQLQEDTSK